MGTIKGSRFTVLLPENLLCVDWVEDRRGICVIEEVLLCFWIPCRPADADPSVCPTLQPTVADRAPCQGVPSRCDRAVFCKN